MAIDGHTILKSCLIVAGIRNAGREGGVVRVVFTNILGVSGLRLVPTTETESNYLCHLDRDLGSCF